MMRLPLPYQIHTNRELGMMLRGEKPLAVFSDGYGCFPDVVERYLRWFDQHVERGRLLRLDYVEILSRPPGIRRLHVIMYSLPDEAWRFDAMIELRAQMSQWSADDERQEGELLGYSDWENDRYAEYLAARSGD